MYERYYRPQRSWGKVMFLNVSVILFTGGGVVSQHALQVVSQHALQQGGWGVVSQHALQVSRPTPRGEVEGSGWGGLQSHTWGEAPGLHHGGLQAHTWGVSRPTPGGCIPACTEADPPWLLLWAVRILLECFLV